MKRLFVTGIGTGIGKTVSSAVLCNVLTADYWKPIQAGDVDSTDSFQIASLVPHVKVHPEWIRLKAPMSPHAAAALEGRTIDLETIIIPQTKNTLLIEGAGGLMVPLNKKDLVIDLIKKVEAEVIVISQYYLGSINHTLLTLEALRARKIPIAGILFNGDEVRPSKDAIMNFGQVRDLGHIPKLPEITAESIQSVSLNLGL